VIPIASRAQLLARINLHTLHAGPRECRDSAGQLAQELSRELGAPVSPGAPHEKRDRWGRLAVRRRLTRQPTAPGPPSSSCESSLFRRAGSARGGSGRRPARSSTGTGAR
jgi:hypothetical protein